MFHLTKIGGGWSWLTVISGCLKPHSSGSRPYCRPRCCSSRPVRDSRRVATLLPALPDAESLIADKENDSDEFSTASARRAITPGRPGGTTRKQPLP